MTADEFYALWMKQSRKIADEFYPEGTARREEFFQNQGIIFVGVLADLQEESIIE